MEDYSNSYKPKRERRVGGLRQGGEHHVNKLYREGGNHMESDGYEKRKQTMTPPPGTVSINF